MERVSRESTRRELAKEGKEIEWRSEDMQTPFEDLEGMLIHWSQGTLTPQILDTWTIEHLYRTCDEIVKQAYELKKKYEQQSQSRRR